MVVLCRTLWVCTPLLRFDSGAEVQALMEAAARREMPRPSWTSGHARSQAPYKHTLLLNRPDFHVAWRGNRIPSDPGALLDLVRGAVRA